MDIVSPYGKDVTAELKSVYKVASVEELVGRVRRFLAERYAFKAVHLEQLHVAFGIAVRFVYKGECYYLKFAGRANHRQPEALFSYFEYLRAHQLPLPEVVRTHNGAPFENILEASPYDVTYVMKALPGGVMARKTARRLERCVDVMAAFHRLGADYTPRVYTGSRDVHAYFREARESLEGLEGLTPSSRACWNAPSAVRTRFWTSLEEVTRSRKRTFTGISGSVTSFLGVDVFWNYRRRALGLRRACLRCLCGPGQPHPSGPLSALGTRRDEILDCLRRYEGRYAFNAADHQALKGMMICVLLNELAGALLFTGTGRSEARATDIKRVWRTLQHFEKLPEGLGLAG